MAATVLGSGAVPEPRIEIEYCTQCRWLLRAGWMAQELLTTFPAELGEVALVPGSGGVFEGRGASPAGGVGRGGGSTATRSGRAGPGAAPRPGGTPSASCAPVSPRAGT